MNTQRIIWRRACAVRLPSRDTAVHAELSAALERDRLNATMAVMSLELRQALERELETR